MNCKKCRFSKRCHEYLFQMLRCTPYNAEIAMRCIWNNRVEWFNEALKVLQAKAEVGHLHFAKVFYRYENMAQILVGQSGWSDQVEDEHDRIFLSALEHGPEVALNIIHEVFISRQELIFQTEEILFKLSRRPEYLKVWRLFVSLKGRLQIGELTDLHQKQVWRVLTKQFGVETDSMTLN